MRPSTYLITCVLLLMVVTIITAFWFSNLSWLLPFLWGVLVVAIIGDIVSSVPAKQLKIEVELAHQAFVGQTTVMTAKVFRQKARLPHHLVMRLDVPISFTCAGEFAADYQQEGKQALFIAKIVPSKRGQFTVPFLWLKWSSRFSLLEFITRLPIAKSLDIVPDISPVLSGGIDAQIYPLASGQKDMKLRGDGSEFHQLSDFTPGMDPRSIDWKRSARSRSLIVRETRIEKNHQIILCIDSGRLMAEQLGGMSKLDRAINATLAMCWASGIAGDNVGFYSFDSRPRLFIPPMQGRSAFSRIQKTCAQLDYETQETNHTLGLTQLAIKLKKRSLVIIFSDFVDTITAELMIENMSVLAKQHLVIYVALKDPALNKLIHPDHLGLETMTRSVCAHNLVEERRAVLERLDRLGVLCIDTTPTQLTTNLISRYIDIKSRGLL